jgi:hypothetical protein
MITDLYLDVDETRVIVGIEEFLTASAFTEHWLFRITLAITNSREPLTGVDRFWMRVSGLSSADYPVSAGCYDLLPK